MKDMTILGRVLRGEGEHMRRRSAWCRLLEDVGLRVVDSEITSPEIMYGYVLARRDGP